MLQSDWRLGTLAPHAESLIPTVTSIAYNTKIFYYCCSYPSFTLQADFYQKRTLDKTGVKVTVAPYVLDSEHLRWAYMSAKKGEDGNRTVSSSLHVVDL